MSDWLDTLDFLTPDQRATLRLHDLDSAAVIAGLGAADIERTTGLTIGKVSRLMTAAGAAKPGGMAPSPSPSMPIVLEFPKAIPHHEKVARALAAAAGDDPSKLSALSELGVERVVVGTEADPDSDTVNAPATQAMLRHIETGAPVGSTWQGLRVVSIRDVLAPVLFCNPRTGAALQEGRDGVSLIPWAELKREGLRLAAFGYRKGLFEGRAEDWVFAAIRDDAGLRLRITTMAKAEKVDLSSLDEVIVWKAESPPKVRPRLPPRSADDDLSPYERLRELMLSMFSISELKRCLGGHENFAGVLPLLPEGQVSPASFMHSTIDTLVRHGLITSDLQRLFVRERPNRAEEIRRAFAAFRVV